MMDTEKTKRNIKDLKNELKIHECKLRKEQVTVKRLSYCNKKTKEKLFELLNEVAHNQDEIKFYTNHYKILQDNLCSIREKLSKARIAKLSFAKRIEMSQNLNQSTSNNEFNTTKTAGNHLGTTQNTNKIVDKEMQTQMHQLEQEITQNYQKFNELLSHLKNVQV